MEVTDVCEDVLGQEADFEQSTLELSTQEIEVEVQDSLEESKYSIAFSYCPKLG